MGVTDLQTNQPDAPQFRAHSRSRTGHDDPVAVHLSRVSERTARYAARFNAQEEAAIVGLLHDLGKYGELFQRRLDGLEHGIDHWTPGAWACLMRYGVQGIAAALAIQGHHIGLQSLSDDALHKMSLAKLAEYHPRNLILSAQDHELLLRRLQSDGLEIPPPPESTVYRREIHSEPATLLLDIRMLFSALVDADFIETEAHFDAGGPDAPSYRSPGPELDPIRAEDCLRTYLQSLSNESKAPDHVRQLRDDLRAACLDAAERAPGVFTLTAPTGAGKTLSMLTFALRHARLNGLRRIVVVLPYLSIIDQTVAVYQKALAPLIAEGLNYIIEDHSLARVPSESESDDEKHARLLAENWDAPIVITTSVQMLESLMSNRSSRCRKLHRLAQSVVLFDEVQSLPLGLAVPTLATLSRLSARYDTTVVFSTATQPAFDHLNESVKQYCVTGWQPREIVPDDLRLFDRARRTVVRWPQDRERREWAELTEELLQHRQVLCICNLRRHALALHDEFSKRGAGGLFHLSTSMCPAHRRAVLEEVRRRIRPEVNEPCALVSTQCVEAGVDIDFPVVYRALAPLDAVAQAAGRCNREGRADLGEVRVFVPDDDQRPYPDASYQQAAKTTESLLRENEGELDIHDPAVFSRYYRTLYNLRNLADERGALAQAILRRDFVEVARLYRLIEQSTVNVLVPYDRAAFDELATQVLAEGINREWIAKARPYSIGIYQPDRDGPISRCLERVPVVPGRENADDWFILRGDSYGERGLDSSLSSVIMA